MDDPVVATSFGSLRGRLEEGLAVFRGIRYAAPPTGSRRFRPPSPPEICDEIVDADTFGPIAIQPNAGPGSYVPGDLIAQDEDCLTLNLWTQGCDDGRRPVMVFIHGGAFLTGSGSSVMYRGERFAARGVVLVTFNYRLGALGFLAHPLLTDESSGAFANWGLMDQIAALSWVRDNIAGFGGDPENVTVFGESAGAMSIADLLGAPAAKGLFGRAIMESGAATALPTMPAATVAEELAKRLGLAEPSRALLESVSVEALRDAQGEITRAVDQGMGMPFRPVVDGAFLPRPPEDEIAAGHASDIDVLIGTNRDEFKFFAFAGGGFGELDEERVAQLIDGYLEGAGFVDSTLTGAQLVARYREARERRGEAIAPIELLSAIAGDWIFRIPSLRLAESHRAGGGTTFFYRFDWPSPFAGGVLGACHGIEMPFVFGTVRNPIVAIFAGGGDAAVALSDIVQSAWVAFATSGDPSVEATGAWPGYEPTVRATMVFGAETELIEAPGEEERQYWGEHLGRYGHGGPIEGAAPPGVAFLVRNDA